MKSSYLTEQKNGANTTEEKALIGRDIITFCNDWTGDPLSKVHLMRLMSRDNRVLWIDSIPLRNPTATTRDFKRIIEKLSSAMSPLREVEPNIHVLSPLSIPSHGHPLLRKINRSFLRFQIKRAIKTLNFKRIINYVFAPTGGLVAGSFGEESIVYHCVDEYSEFTGVSTKALLEIEEKLLRLSDVVICSAERLVESKSKVNPNTHLVRHGVDFNHFKKALDDKTVVPEDLAKLPKPIIGFFGLIADWVDIDLIAHTAKQFPDATVCMIGKVDTDISQLTSLPNVKMLGRKRYEDLPAYCKGFDVTLMPFIINELTLNANPLKVREYLAAGLQVVSTAIPEVEVLQMCRIAHDKEEFIREVAEALKTPGPDPAISEAIKHESWEAKLDEIRNLL